MNAPRNRRENRCWVREALTTYLDWKHRDYQEAVDGIRRGYADMKAGRTQPAEEAFEELRKKHGIPRGDNSQSGSKGIE